MASAVASRPTENLILRILGAPANQEVDLSGIPSKYKTLTAAEVQTVQAVAKAIMGLHKTMYEGAEESCRRLSGSLALDKALELKAPSDRDLFSFFNMISSVHKLVFSLGVLSVSRESQPVDVQRETDQLVAAYAAMRVRARFFEGAECYSGAPFVRLLDEYKASPTKTIGQVIKILGEVREMSHLRKTEDPESWQAFVGPLLEELMDTVGNFKWKEHSLADLVYNQAGAWDRVEVDASNTKIVASREAAFKDLGKLLKGIAEIEQKLLAAQSPAK